MADIDLRALLAFHEGHNGLATVTAVQPPGRFGALGLADDQETVRSFLEKPPGDGAWMNGGFFVLEPAVLDYIAGDETVFEAEPLERLAANGQPRAYRHRGFWLPMDTLRDKRALEGLWATGMTPWKTW